MSASSWQMDPLFAPHPLPTRRGASRLPWLHTSGFDTTMLILSVGIVPAVLLAVWLGASSDAINLGVTAIVGGPHVFATFTATFADERFRRRHPWLIASSLLIPAGVVWLTIHHYQVLMSVFMIAASLHVLHQCAYVSDCYRTKARLPESRWARFIDYGALFSSIYPIAIYKIVHGTFVLGDVPIIIPSAFMRMETAYLEWAVFGGFLVAWTYKTVAEHRKGTLNVPKTWLLGVTMFFCFLVPGAAGKDRLDLAFQSLNAWHSFQYLGLVWLINTLRLERGLLTNRFVARLSGPKGGKWFYAWNVGISVLLLVVVRSVVAWDPWSLRSEQYYYMLTLSPLLIHYYFDTFVFLTSVSDLVPPLSKSAIASPSFGSA